ncbi:hypothetical protein COR53_01675 [Staphylococcus pettenkoferi]|uniref:hypothetical protein n=1 Tax=Staphylococcus pettenkoferi TaxID=170573 RepID=UPI000F53F172|nr:hypothetical protein [Staphylococcus pettenkoferi]RQN00315.1 hypothetical protein COR53_01675 [Staphylococcus pettenkoferi]
MKKLSILVGEVLYHAQQELSSYGNGTFIKWAESKGIKKSSVYNYINAYKFVQQLDKPRDNRYYKELGYSNFEDYCLNSWNIKRGTMDERIQIAETFSESDFNRYSGQLGHKKTLLLTTMSEPQREHNLSTIC